jgi:hypothetical protein
MTAGVITILACKFIASASAQDAPVSETAVTTTTAATGVGAKPFFLGMTQLKGQGLRAEKW